LTSADPAAGRSAATDRPGRFQILALDGGGVKALFTAHVLARLEEDLGVSVTDSFDLIAGTSAGGIVALALGAGLCPSEIVTHYADLITTVFPERRRRPLRIPNRVRRPAYSADDLRAALTGVLGDRLLGQSTKRLVIPSWDVHNGEVHIFKTPHHERLRRDWRIKMVDVAMATSAAPTFFPSAPVDGVRLIDGGVWANNPSVIAITEARSMLGADLDHMRVLNIGTMDAVSRPAPALDNGGLLAWAKPAANVIITASSRGGQGIAEHLVGPTNYHRFDARVPEGLYQLDAADPTGVASYASAAARNLSPIFRTQFADHHASTYQPLAGPTGAQETPPTSPEQEH
jgi:predicted acylesterase/phospholipase RssA